MMMKYFIARQFNFPVDELENLNWFIVEWYQLIYGCIVCDMYINV